MPSSKEVARAASQNWNARWRARLAELESRSDGLSEAERQEFQLLDLRRQIKRQRSKDRRERLQEEANRAQAAEVLHIELPPVGPLLDLQRKVLADLLSLEKAGLVRVG